MFGLWLTDNDASPLHKPELNASFSAPRWHCFSVPAQVVDSLNMNDAAVEASILDISVIAERHKSTI
jgi:hypothetical protein